jgi:hypothetical protein
LASGGGLKSVVSAGSTRGRPWYDFSSRKANEQMLAESGPRDIVPRMSSAERQRWCEPRPTLADTQTTQSEEAAGAPNTLADKETRHEGCTRHSLDVSA